MIEDAVWGVLRAREDRIDLEVKRVVQHRIQRERATRLRPGIGADFRIRTVQGFAEHEEAGIPACRGERVDGRTPGLPETHFNMADGVDPEPIEARLFYPILVN